MVEIRCLDFGWVEKLGICASLHMKYSGTTKFYHSEFLKNSSKTSGLKDDKNIINFQIQYPTKMHNANVSLKSTTETTFYHSAVDTK